MLAIVTKTPVTDKYFSGSSPRNQVERRLVQCIEDGMQIRIIIEIKIRRFRMN